MLKKFRIPVAPKALALALALPASAVFAQPAELDVILRDFDITYPGIEEFDADLGSSGHCAESNDARTNMWTDENRICFNSEGRYGNCNDYPTQLMYGKCNGGGDVRGYTNGPDRHSQCASSGGQEWQNPVGVTKGMVQGELEYPDCDILEDDPNGLSRRWVTHRYCARPMVGNGFCYGANVSNYFTDGEHARTYTDILELPKVPGTANTYRINYDFNTSENWNGFGNDNGYFPLDKYEGVPDKYGRYPFGLQGLNIWCPPIGTGINYDLGEDCRTWKRYGSAKEAGSAQAAAEANPSLKRKLHNYGFSMMGTGTFKYDRDKNDKFKFIGDDDMWIFIDGKLVADLGGTHLAAPAVIYINEIADARPEDDWTPNSFHVINFFYMDRQTDGSNMMLEVALNEMGSSRFGSLKIVKAETTVNDDGTASTIIWVSSELNIEQIRAFTAGMGYGFPIVVKNPGMASIKGGYELKSIAFGTKTSEGYTYTITGQVCLNPSCTETSILNSGDSIAFNVLNVDYENANVTHNNFALSGEEKYIRNSSGRSTETLEWALNNSKLPPIVFEPEVNNPGPERPVWGPDNINDIFNGGAPGTPDNSVPGGAGGGTGGKYDGSGKIPNITQVWDPKANGGQGGMVPINQVEGAKGNNDGNADVHGFGTIGQQIPPQRAGELILTAFPSYADKGAYDTWKDSEAYRKYFGLPPMSDYEDGGTDPRAWWGLTDPLGGKTRGANESSIGNGYQFIKNGFPNESSTKGTVKIAPSRCTSSRDRVDPSTGKPLINCLNFNLPAKGPFQLAVTIYDQLGNFVTQYRESVTEQEFRNVTQAPGFASPGAKLPPETSHCVAPNASANGPGAYGHPQTMTANGLVNVNVNIYPFSSTGRRFGNGVYIAKIDRVDFPFSDCKVQAGTVVDSKEEFVRHHAEQKFGWMRAK